MFSWTSQSQLWFDRFVLPIDDAGSRLFHLNLLIAFILVCIWIFLSRPRGSFWRELNRSVFRKKYWWNRSAKTDYRIYFLNSLLKVFLFIPFLDCGFAVARGTSEALVRMTGDFAGLEPRFWTLLSFTAVVFVWDDFLRFFQHYLMHKIPWLWRLHRLHHSARVLTPITLFRNHPAESALATLRNGLSLGVATGVFVYLFESRLNLVTLFGVNVFGFLFNLMGANLRHSQIRLSFGRKIESLFISPLQHQVHHSRSPEHFDKNFGVSLSLWDRLTGTLVYSEQVGPLRFGIHNEGSKKLRDELRAPRA